MEKIFKNFSLLKFYIILFIIFFLLFYNLENNYLKLPTLIHEDIKKTNIGLTYKFKGEIKKIKNYNKTIFLIICINNNIKQNKNKSNNTFYINAIIFKNKNNKNEIFEKDKNYNFIGKLNYYNNNYSIILKKIVK